MAVNIDQKCAARLQEKLSTALADLNVQNGMFIQRSSIHGLLACESILPQTGKIHEELASYIDDSPITEFVYGTLSRELLARNKYEADSTHPITDLDEYSNAEILSKRLVDSFCALPYWYTFSTPLPAPLSSALSALTEPIALNERIRILPINDEVRAEFETTTGDETLDRHIHGGSLLGATTPSPWTGVYLQIQIPGYIGTFTRTAPIMRAENILKAILGLLFALRAIRRGFSFSPSMTRKFLVHRRGEGRWMLHERSDIEPATAAVIADLALEDLDGKISSDVSENWTRAQVLKVRSVFLNEDKSDKIVLSAQWLFESYSTQNELLAFVQAMVCLEILLGDKASSDVMGLGELLRNRCAYMVGKTPTQREEILRDFNEIYKVRSQIVHRGKSVLRNKERALFYQLRWLCSRVLQEEIDLLIADPESRK
ncbi:hypothetical protein GVN24_35045 [Rhizobium sp. CRIBSB]|nr:hypothetical protein [Rhizobium sp. CRIBSB]